MVKLFPSANGKKVIVKAPFNQKEIVKQIPGRTWNKSLKVWEVPMENLEQIYKFFPDAMAHPDLEGVAKAVREKNKKAVDVKNQKNVKIGKIKGLKGKLYDFQKQGVAFLDTLQDREGAILAFDMGLGKTITSIAAFLKLLAEGEKSKCMIVCPASLKYSAWKKEIVKWTKSEYIVVDGDSDENQVEYEDGKIVKLRGKNLREVQYQQDVEFVILNYELFLHDIDLLPIVDEDWVVVFDEAHRIKNPKGVTVQNIIQHCGNAGRKYLLTGTPLENNLPELFSLVNFCREGLLGTWTQFRGRYIIDDHFGNPIGINYQALPELKQTIAPIIIRKRKDEVFDLPPLVEQEYWVEMTALQKQLYEEIKEGILAIVDDGGEEDFSYLDILAQLTRIKQLLDSPALLREATGREDLPLESGKLKELPKIFEDINIAENKVIVFSQYRGMTDILYDTLTEKYGKEVVRYIHGSVKAKDRAVYQNDFQENDDVKIIILTTAGNYGLDLYKASYVVCYDQLFNPQKMNQVISRAHRHGVEKTVVAINMVTRHSYEERILEILKTKKEIFNAMIEDDESFMQEFVSKQELIDLI